MMKIGNMIKSTASYLVFLIRTKGFFGIFARLVMLVRRFDFSGLKSRRSLEKIARIGDLYKYNPSVFVPAIIVRKHFKLIKTLANQNIDLAIHGLHHKNYRSLTLREQEDEIEQAKKIFEDLKIPFSGFRTPYLSSNRDTIKAVQNAEFSWESSETYLWNGFDKYRHRHFHDRAIRILYDSADAEKSLVRPQIVGNVVRLPISLPDDEILVDRYAYRNSQIIENIWYESLLKAHAKGDLFMLQLHPERFPICGESMHGLLKKVQALKPPVWIASAVEIAKWWKEKSRFSFHFSKLGNGYLVHCQATKRATIVGKNLDSKKQKDAFGGRYRMLSEENIFIRSFGKKPCVGIHPKCSKGLETFLSNEGFPFEITKERDAVSVFFDEYPVFNNSSQLDVIKKIEDCSTPIIRFWIWPSGNKSAFTTTHDLDCMTLLDFLVRPIEA